MLFFPVMKLLDTTLREGEQRYGVYFPLEIRQKIACFLMELGIEEIEVGVVCKDEDMEKIMETIALAARTGKIGDGKIFVYEVLDAMRIRSGERGEAAI